MKTITRFRVRKAGATWTSHGPDLLRTEDNARAQLKSMLDPGAGTGGWYTRRKDGPNKGPWVGPLSRAEALDDYDKWDQNKDTFQVGRKGKSAVVVHSEVLACFIDVKPLDNCSPATSLLHALIHFQFPKVVHSGDFLFRQIDGSTDWSDHAWGTALDESPRDGMANDTLFTWLVRMFATGNAEADYVLGSINGKVKSASAPDWDVRDSSASVSHTWHNHVSIVDHDGRKPPRNPMFP